MGFRLERKPFKMGVSNVITLPAGWCNYYKDRINPLTLFGDTVIILAPMGFESLAEELIEEAPKIRLRQASQQEIEKGRTEQ